MSGRRGGNLVVVGGGGGLGVRMVIGEDNATLNEAAQGSGSAAPNLETVFLQ